VCEKLEIIRLVEPSQLPPAMSRGLLFRRDLFLGQKWNTTGPERIVVIGANGQVGRLVIADLLKAAPETHVIGIVSNAAAAKDWEKLIRYAQAESGR